MADHSVLFVCLGNICRSPLAEGVLRSMVDEGDSASPGARETDRFEIDSAGTGSWHVGEGPDPRSVQVAERHGIRLTGRARQVRASDFSEFNWIIAMDGDNLRALERLRGQAGGRARLLRLREFDPLADGELDVPDPYYGGPDGFDRVFEMVERSCAALLDHVRASG